MDFATAVVTLAVGALTVLPRIPALSAEGREQSRLQRDVELWSAMPHGDARDGLGAQIEERTAALLVERKRDKTVEEAWRYGTGWLAIAWVLLVASTAVEGDVDWAVSVRLALEVAGLSTGVVGLFLLLLTVALLAWQAILRVLVKLGWLRRREPVEYEI